MAGAQVVPIFYHYSTQQLAALLPKINGVFFPGGEMPIDNNNQWTSNIGFILNFAKKENDMGRSFPLWATCLGYEAVMYITSGLNDNMTVLTRVNGQRGLRGNLTVTNTNSPLIRSLSVKEYEEVTKGEGLLWFHHTWAVTLETYNAQTPLNSFWKLVSTSVTEDNVVFVSTVEARNYPFFMTQYHPEKNSYEWKIDAARSYDAVSV
jgi:gamma-glutamyl hydrolase